MLKVATAQFNAIAGNFGHNLKIIVSLLEDAAQKQVRLVLFPELSISGYDLSMVEEGRCSINEKGDGLAYLLNACRRLKIYAVLGVCIQREEGISNSALIINDVGEIIGIYDKHYLDSSEKEIFLLGKQGFLFEIDQWVFSVAISYDSYYPEHAKEMTFAGAQVYLILGAFIKGGYMKVESNYFSERAIENKIYILISNYIGDHSGMSFSGDSSIFSPDGRLMVSGNEAMGIYLAELKILDTVQDDNTILISTENMTTDIIRDS